jgi:poly(3-hydroxybutyrate) depolymerase
MHPLSVALVCGLVLSLAPAEAWTQKVTKESFVSHGRPRNYYLLVPDNVTASAPLIVLLHGSGRDGKSIIDPWSDLARREGIILAAPDSADRVSWGMSEDGPHFLHDLVERLMVDVPVYPRRVYLFGHSAGAIQALDMAILVSEYFAAVAAHAGVITREIGPFIPRAPRRIPIAIWVGTDDRSFPLAAVRVTRDALAQAGFNPMLTEIPRHTHDYYRRSGDINREVWAFLGDKKLDHDPRYQTYAMGGR